MSHSAISTALTALFSTGPLRQYASCMALCQKSAMACASRPIANGFTWRSIAASTARNRCVKVPQPQPCSPGWSVTTLATMSGMPAGCTA